MRSACEVRIALLVLASGTGCGGPTDNLPREPVSGTVRFEGKPLETGVIQFHPSPGQVMTQAGAIIQGGSYQIPRQEGPVPGTYRVVISSSVGAPAPAGPPGRELPPPKESIPARYNARSGLTAEVKQAGENQFDFDLK